MKNGRKITDDLRVVLFMLGKITDDLLIVLFMLGAILTAGLWAGIEAHNNMKAELAEIRQENALHDEMLETFGDGLMMVERNNGGK